MEGLNGIQTQIILVLDMEKINIHHCFSDYTSELNLKAGA